MKNGFQKVLVGAILALTMIAGSHPANADPASRTLLTTEKTQVQSRLDSSKTLNLLGREKGGSGLISRDRTADFLSRDKGSRGALTLERRRLTETPRLLSHARTSLLRQKSFFGSRPLVSLLNTGKNTFRSSSPVGSLIRNRPNNLRISSVFSSKAPRRSTTANRPSAPSNNLASIQGAINSFFRENTLGAYFIQADPRTGQTYRLQFAQSPVTRQVNANKAAVRCAFYGQTGVNAPSIPVVVEYTLASAGNNWKIDRVQFVSVNGQKLAGQFDIQDEDMMENASAALDEKSFPTKSL